MKCTSFGILDAVRVDLKLLGRMHLFYITVSAHPQTSTIIQEKLKLCCFIFLYLVYYKN